MNASVAHSAFIAAAVAQGADELVEIVAALGWVSSSQLCGGPFLVGILFLIPIMRLWRRCVATPLCPPALSLPAARALA